MLFGMHGRRTLSQVLKERDFPYSSIKMLASSRYVIAKTSRKTGVA